MLIQLLVASKLNQKGFHSTDAHLYPPKPGSGKDKPQRLPGNGNRVELPDLVKVPPEYRILPSVQ